MLAEVVVTAKRNKNAASPEEQKPKAPEDPKGTLVTEYKGYSLYKKDTGFGIDLDAYTGDVRYNITTYASPGDEGNAVVLAKEQINRGAVK
jgi:hypothetical protein